MIINIYYILGPLHNEFRLHYPLWWIWRSTMLRDNLIRVILLRSLQEDKIHWKDKIFERQITIKYWKRNYSLSKPSSSPTPSYTNEYAWFSKHWKKELGYWLHASRQLFHSKAPKFMKQITPKSSKIIKHYINLHMSIS